MRSWTLSGRTRVTLLLVLPILTVGLASCSAREIGSSIGARTGGVIAIGEAGEQPPIPEVKWALMDIAHYLSLTDE